MVSMTGFRHQHFRVVRFTSLAVFGLVYDYPSYLPRWVWCLPSKVSLRLFHTLFASNTLVHPFWPYSSPPIYPSYHFLFLSFIALRSYHHLSIPFHGLLCVIVATRSSYLHTESPKKGKSIIRLLSDTTGHYTNGLDRLSRVTRDTEHRVPCTAIREVSRTEQLNHHHHHTPPP